MTLGLDIAGWSLEIDGNGHRISAVDDAGAALSLSFAPDPSGVPTLHNETGWLNTPVGWTYYYSWPDLAVTGSLVIDGRAYDVEGTGWFDHQWGALSGAVDLGGDWFALQLDDDRTGRLPAGAGGL